MGSVVFCNDTNLDRMVAIKFLQNPDDVRRMMDEFAALLKMRSKHVVQVFDVIEADNDEIGIVQEFIGGRDLLEDDTPQANQVSYLKTLWQIASGISDIHEVDVIHRDIKPNNMKLDAEGIVKIFDFGLARDEGLDAQTRGFVGTFGFAAPELYGDEVSFTKAVDVYAFGATALYLTTKTLPAELRMRPPRLINGDYFGTTPFGIDPELARVLQNCLAYAPEARPAMRDVANLLQKHLCRDRHQALVVFRERTSFLNAGRRSVRLDLPGVGGLEIQYDGLAFRVSSFSGEVQINNRLPILNEELPGSCVASLGVAPRPANSRAFITFDTSHPEIIL
ncbi:serine/threonine-protein kinase [Caballeronia sp. KNU42]